MSLVVQEDVVQLQVAVDDAFLMQEVERNADFSSVKPVGKTKRNAEKRMRSSKRNIVLIFTLIILTVLEYTPDDKHTMNQVSAVRM